MRNFILIFSLVFLLNANEVKLHILGSGGPELHTRASSSYLLTVDGKAKILIDTGSGSLKNFSRVGAQIEDLKAILVTHTHIDHINDLSAFVKAGYFTDRTKSLPIFGTISSAIMPSIKEYLQRLFGSKGAYAYMQDVLSKDSDSFTLIPIVLPKKVLTTKISPNISITSVGVNHGIIPALAYRVEIDGKVFVFSGDTTAKSDNLIKVAKNADFFVAHYAIPEFGYNVAAQLHMRPSKIAQVASSANVKHLILSHLMKRSLKAQDESINIIKKTYKGKVSVASDLLTFY